MTTPHVQISARLALPQLVLAGRHGLDATSLCREVGLDASLLQDPEVRIPLPRFEALLEALASRVKVPTLGLELAREFSLETYGVTALVMMASPTLREGFQRAFHYQRLWEDFERLSLEPREGGASVRLLSWDPRRPLHRILTECVTAELLLMTRQITAPPVLPLWVHFQHESPPDTSPYEAFFGIPVSFGAPFTEIAFSNATNGPRGSPRGDNGWEARMVAGSRSSRSWGEAPWGGCSAPGTRSSGAGSRSSSSSPGSPPRAPREKHPPRG